MSLRSHVMQRRRELWSFIVTVAMAGVGVSLLVSSFTSFASESPTVSIVIGILLLIGSTFALGGFLTKTNEETSLQFRFSHHVEPTEFMREVSRSDNIPSMDTYDWSAVFAYQSLVKSNPQEIERVKELKMGSEGGGISQLSPRGFDEFDSLPEDQRAILEYFYDFMAYLILNWLSHWVFSFRSPVISYRDISGNEVGLRFARLNRDQLPSEWTKDNIFMKAVPDNAKTIILPKNFAFHYEPKPFPTVNLCGRYAVLQLTYRLREAGIMGDHFVSSYEIQLRRTAKRLSWFAGSWELGVVDELIDNLRSYLKFG